VLLAHDGCFCRPAVTFDIASGLPHQRTSRVRCDFRKVPISLTKSAARSG
jgi:hypothetical protein